MMYLRSDHEKDAEQKMGGCGAKTYKTWKCKVQKEMSVGMPKIASGV
jgi:hypothetical protein